MPLLSQISPATWAVGWSPPIIEGSYIWESLWSLGGWIWVSLWIHQLLRIWLLPCSVAVLGMWKRSSLTSVLLYFFFVSSVLTCLFIWISFYSISAARLCCSVGCSQGKSLWWHSQRDLTLRAALGRAEWGTDPGCQVTLTKSKVWHHFSMVFVFQSKPYSLYLYGTQPDLSVLSKFLFNKPFLFLFHSSPYFITTF